MTGDELVDVLELAYAESGRDPDMNVAAVWLAAVGEFPVGQVKAAVARFVAGHVWPPKAAEIRRILVGVDEHGAGQSFTTAVALVRAGRVSQRAAVEFEAAWAAVWAVVGSKGPGR